MASRAVFITTFGFATCIIIVGHILADETPEVVPGVAVEGLPAPLFYETFIPVIHEFILPNWKATDMMVQWPSGHSTLCENSDTFSASWNQQACPIVYHFNRLISSYANNITTWKEFATSYARTAPEMESVSFSCDEIQPHFSKSTATQEELRKYLAQLRKCPTGIILEKMGINQFANISGSPYSTMLARSLVEYSNRLGSYINLASLTNTYTALQGMELLNFYVESNRWRNALTSCNSRTIPFDLIPQQQFGQILKEILPQVAKTHYEFTIPSTDLSEYYKSPLAECVFTENTSIVVRILIPIKRVIGSNYELVRAHSIPFVKMGLSPKEPNMVCSMQDIEGKYVYERSTGVVAKTSCSKTDLCMIQSGSRLPIPKPCLSSIFSNNVTLANVENNCDMSCFPVKAESFPIFRRLSSDTYTISGKQNMDIFINCAGKPYKVISPNETGALLVKLRCDCQIVYKSEDLHAVSPCGDKLILKHIIPRIWAKENKAKDSSKLIPKPPPATLDSINNEGYESASAKDGTGLDQIASDLSWLTLQIFILWGAVILLAILSIVLIVKVVQISYFTKRQPRKPERSSNEYEVPFMLKHSKADPNSEQ